MQLTWKGKIKVKVLSKERNVSGILNFPKGERYPWAIRLILIGHANLYFVVSIIITFKFGIQWLLFCLLLPVIESYASWKMLHSGKVDIELHDHSPLQIMSRKTELISCLFPLLWEEILYWLKTLQVPYTLEENWIETCGKY